MQLRTLVDVCGTAGSRSGNIETRNEWMNAAAASLRVTAARENVSVPEPPNRVVI
jgi:ABC-type enterochelin transport system substrate-binding protein